MNQLDTMYSARNDSPAASDAFYTAVRKAAFNALERDEDAAQDVTLDVLTGLPGFNDAPGSPFSHWFATVVRNHKADRLRQKISDRDTLVELDDQTVPASSPSEAFLDISFIKDEITHRIAGMVLQGYSQAEIGADLGMTRQAVGDRLSRLRN